MMAGYCLLYDAVYFISFSLVAARAGHMMRMCRRSSCSEQEVESRQFPPLFLDQWLQSFSVLYLPEIIKAWMVAMATFAGDCPAVVHIGCGVVNDINAGLKNSKEGSLSVSEQGLKTSERSCFSQ